MGALQAASLLIRDHCDVLIHINADVPKIIPAYNRIRAFEDTCKEHHVPYELNLNVCGDSYQELFSQMKIIFADIDEKYPGQKGCLSCERHLCKYVPESNLSKIWMSP